jgi:hypothetical protein
MTEVGRLKRVWVPGRQATQRKIADQQKSEKIKEMGMHHGAGSAGGFNGSKIKRGQRRCETDGSHTQSRRWACSVPASCFLVGVLGDPGGQSQRAREAAGTGVLHSLAAIGACLHSARHKHWNTTYAPRSRLPAGRFQPSQHTAAACRRAPAKAGLLFDESRAVMTCGRRCAV